MLAFLLDGVHDSRDIYMPSVHRCIVSTLDASSLIDIEGGNAVSKPGIFYQTNSIGEVHYDVADTTIRVGAT